MDTASMAVTFNIDNCQISRDGADCYVIAEIGHNHQGDLTKAKEFFRSAKECGVNAVKLQKRLKKISNRAGCELFGSGSTELAKKLSKRCREA